MVAQGFHARARARARGQETRGRDVTREVMYERTRQRSGACCARTARCERCRWRWSLALSGIEQVVVVVSTIGEVCWMKMSKYERVCHPFNGWKGIWGMENPDCGSRYMRRTVGEFRTTRHRTSSGSESQIACCSRAHRPSMGRGRDECRGLLYICCHSPLTKRSRRDTLVVLCPTLNDPAKHRHCVSGHEM